MAKKRVVKQKIERDVDFGTGQVLVEKISQTYYESKEPQYVKLYISDMSKLRGLPNSVGGLLNEMLSYLGYDGLVDISARRRRIICDNLRVGADAVRRGIKKLVEKGIIAKIETNVYMPNPHLFGRGQWKECDELRAGVSLNDKGAMVLMDWLQRKLKDGRSDTNRIDNINKIG
jgi:hypothetical protein